MSYDPPLVAPLSDYFRVPVHPPDSRRTAAFAALLESLRKNDAVALARYDLPYPRHEFLRFAAEQCGVLMHGSNDPNIDVMSPQRRTLDARHTHSQTAVFACADGIWPLYFALIDRSSYVGTLRNDARVVRENDGEQSRAYYLSVNQTANWLDGTVYLLPNDTFSRLGDESSLEWASALPVKPFARISVSATDFPLLGQVRTHDDSPLQRMRDLSIKLVSTHDGYEELPDGYAIRYLCGWSAEAHELITLLKAVNPWLQGEIETDASGGMTVRLQGSSALKDMLGQGLASPRVPSPPQQADRP